MTLTWAAVVGKSYTIYRSARAIFEADSVFSLARPRGDEADHVGRFFIRLRRVGEEMVRYLGPATA